MDAIKYIEEKERMCKSLLNCEGCPIRYTCDPNAEEAKEVVAIVEKWSREHPKIVNGARVIENIKEMGAPRVTFFPYDTNDICVYFDKDWWDAPYGG